MEENVKGKRCRDHSTPTASRLTYGVQRHGVVRALEGPVDQWARCAVHAREDLDLLDARRLLGPPPPAQSRHPMQNRFANTTATRMRKK